MNKAWQDEVDFGRRSQTGGHARHPGANVSVLRRQRLRGKARPEPYLEFPWER